MKTPHNTLVVLRTCWFVLAFILCTQIASAMFRFEDKIDSIRLNYNPNELLLPGESFPIEAVVFFKNGKVKTTSNFIKNSVSWHKFHVEVIGGTFTCGRVTINSNLLPAKGKYILIKACPKRASWMTKKMLLPLNYETKIRIIPEPDLIKAPGFGFQFTIWSQFNNGAKREYDYRFCNKNQFPYLLSFDGGRFKLNKFVIDSDFRKIRNHTILINAVAVRNPSCETNFLLQLDYLADYTLSYAGSSGFSASCGSGGSTGSKGDNGGDGNHGGDGQDGSRGPDIGVWADVYFDSILGCKLMYVYTENFWSGRECVYLINPSGGRLFVHSTGGRGGDGGHGGKGGDGGNGANGCWHSQEVAVNDSTTKIVRWQERGHDGGNGGQGGSGGNGGWGGNGGDIYVYLSSDAVPYAKLIVADSDGGTGGTGGFGGSGGSGGRGGSGQPDGSNGCSGGSGNSGSSGWWGSSGSVYYDWTEDFVTYTPVASIPVRLASALPACPSIQAGGTHFDKRND